MDPERPIETLLRKAAEARRAQPGATQELHPANRRVLQSEVARKFGSGPPPKRSFLDSLNLLMPRLAWSAALVVGLGLAASLMLPRRNPPPQEMFFAKNERMPSLQTANEPKPAPAASKQPDTDAAQHAGESTPGTPLASELSARATRTDEVGRRAIGNANMELAQEAREKDSLNVERRSAESQKSTTLALNAPASQLAAAGGSLSGAKQKEELAPASSALPPVPATSEGNALQRSYGFSAPAQRRSSSAVSTVAAGPSSSPTAQSGDERSKADLAYKSMQPIAASAPGSAGAPLKTADAKRQPAQIARASQKYVQIESLKKGAESELSDKLAVAKPILVSFELQQVGREVRIIDNDGSVYSGSVQSFGGFSDLRRTNSESVSSRQSFARQSQSKTEVDNSKIQPGVAYAFTVSGTNQSLNQKVIFTGQILPSTVNDQSAATNGNGITLLDVNPLPLLNSRISGKAIIGTNQEIQVNAIQAH